MLNLLSISLIFDILIVNGDSSKSQSRQYQSLFYQPESPYGNVPTRVSNDQKWFYSSNQQPMAFSWYWTNNDRPSSNFYKNTLPLNQVDQLSTWACGRSEVTNRFSRIMGGRDAIPYSYPWMVSLAKRSLNNLHLCGGVLLTRRHVLTAAHCIEDFKGAQDMNVFAGIHYINEKKNPIPALTIDIHPQYEADTFANDVALVTLTTPMPENDPRIGTICLPSEEISTKNFPDLKSSAIAVGWGSTSFGGRPSNALKQVVLPLLETNKWPCNIYVTHEQGQICAGELTGGVDTCQADSGGPLMVENGDGRWEIIGITSFGKSCGKPNTPGIYTRVSSYTSFIRSSISLSKQGSFYASASYVSPPYHCFVYILFAIVFYLM